MGTDIHMVVEVRSGKKWKRAVIDRPCSNCEGKLKCERLDGSTYDCSWCEKNPGKEPYGGGFNSRSYDTFAILADVRNGHGFAGTDTGDGFTPMSAQRGVPDGFVAKKDWELGDHSFSWLTLSELLTYPHWEKTTKKRGTVSMDGFVQWEASGKKWPREWSGGISGPSIYYVSNETMRGLIADNVAKQAEAHAADAKRFQWKDVNVAAPQFYTVVEWAVQYKECAKEFHDEFIPALCKLGAPEDVRIVFGFDS